MKLFISYAHDDEFLVRTQIVDVLLSGGHEPWFDHALIPGKDWQLQLLEAISDSEAFVYAMTPRSLESEWCLWEYGHAVRLGKPIMPVLLVRATIPPELGTIQYVDFTQGATGHPVAKLMGGLQMIDRSRVQPVPAAPTGAPAQAVPDHHREIERELEDEPSRKASSLSEDSTPSKSIVENPPKIAPLRSFKPLDWLRLYWWIFFHPGGLLDHRAAFGVGQESGTAAWLASTLALLPLLIPTLTTNVGSTTWRFNASSDLIVMLIAGLWLASGVFDSFFYPLPRWAFVVAFVVAFGLAGGVAVGLMNVIMVGQALDLVDVVTSAFVAVVAFGVASVVAGVMVGIVTFGRAGGTAFGLAVGVAFSVAFIAAGGVAGSVAFAVVVGVAVNVANNINERLQQGIRKPYWLSVVLGLLTPLSYIFLLVISF